MKLVKERESYPVILTSATEEPEKIGDEYISVFRDLGLDEIQILDINNRKEAYLDKHINLLRKAGGVFFTGGDQLRISGIFGGTPFNQVLQEIYNRGAIIAGTSAGASVVSDIMIIGGKNDDTPMSDSVRLAPGLGLLEEIIIDQHFAQRGRLARLMMIIAYNPGIMGIGIDEDTAVEIVSTGSFTVRGNGTVIVLDGSKVTHSNVADVNRDTPLALLNLKAHVLPADYGFALGKREVVLPKN